jgi:hypothetical protein
LELLELLLAESLQAVLELLAELAEGLLQAVAVLVVQIPVAWQSVQAELLAEQVLLLAE